MYISSFLRIDYLLCSCMKFDKNAISGWLTEFMYLHFANQTKISFYHTRADPSSKKTEGAGARRTVVHIIWPPGWDRVNCSTKNWGAFEKVCLPFIFSFVWLNVRSNLKHETPHIIQNILKGYFFLLVLFFPPSNWQKIISRKRNYHKIAQRKKTEA